MLRWTPAGLQAIQEAESSGTKIKATHIAIGDGGGQTPDHSGSTMLVNELYRQPIDTIAMVDAPDVPSGKVVEFGVSIPETKPETGSWMIREVAILADDTVIGIGPHPELEKVGKDSPKGTMTHTITAPMVVSNEAVISLAIAPSVHATMEALSDHNEDSQAHQDIREACTTAISEHNRNDGAHKDIRQAHQTAVDEITAQKEALETLEEKVVNTGVRQAVLSYGEGISVEATEVKGMDSVDYMGDGQAGLPVNLGMPFAGGEYGGMVMACTPSFQGNRLIQDTILGVDKYIRSDSAAPIETATGGVREWTNTGITVGNSDYFNKANQSANIIAFQTTNILPMDKIIAKSVCFDFANNWSGTNSIAIRSIEFLDKRGEVIPMRQGVDFGAIATSKYSESFDPHFAFDTTKTKVGNWTDNSWLSHSGISTNQRLTIVFNTPQTFYGIQINNGHASGTANDAVYGAKDFAIYATDQAVELVVGGGFGNTGNGLTKLVGARLRKHKLIDASDPIHVFGDYWHFNPATGFAMVLYHGWGVTRALKHPMGKRLAQGWFKKIDDAMSWYVYSDKIGGEKYLCLDTDDTPKTNPGDTGLFWAKNTTENEIFLGVNEATNSNDNEYMFYGWFGDDLGSTTPGMTGVLGSTAFVSMKGGETVGLGFEAETIIAKAKNTGHWHVVSRDRGWDKFTLLNSPWTESDLSKPLLVEGTKLTLQDNWGSSEGYIIMAIGKQGQLPKGRSIQIKASTESPFVANISKGFGPEGNRDKIIYKDTPAIYPQTKSDGRYDLVLLDNGAVDLIPEKSYVTDIVKWMNDKLIIGSCKISDGLVVDLELMPTGDEYETPWFPVTLNTKYILSNLFQTPKSTFEIYWNSAPTDENKRYCGGQYYYQARTIGAYKRVNSNELIVGSGSSYTFSSRWGADPVQSAEGFYKLKVKRGF
ncbi:phage tail protein [Desulfoluna butyratoxydans]|uniref:Phage tail fibre protein n=1 Tax=Desulfoluna butyratoxydans TaxID=231438 RepID=A0A4U8YP47_9BACT|nr:phage tail protein [Desulfoluna butyratoxydans]VFQ45946.1 phage tail fibre protein [Desulfoluna butyratoxydans]